MRAGKRHELVGLEKVKDALTIEVGDDANVVAVVETVAQVDALVPVLCVVRGERREHAEFNA